MAWHKTDVARSIRRYLSLMWDEGSDWTIRVERRVVADDDRPVAVVLTGNKRVLAARSAREQGNLTEAIPVTIYAYPKVGDDERAANQAAEAISDQLTDLLTFGLTVQDADGKDFAGPFVIPLWDYADVPLAGPNRAGPDDPHDVLWVERESIEASNLQDPEDGRRRTVAVDFRVTVERPGRTRPDSDLVSGLPGGFKTAPTP